MIDTDLSKVMASELMAWGLANLWKQGNKGGYAVHHGLWPVNDFSKPQRDEDTETPAADHHNYFEKAFPCLFPYGCGGPESDRPQEVLFNNQIKYALQYHDRHFRKHETFSFVAFGISQRHQALNSAQIQVWRKNFDADAQVMSTITLEKLQQAHIEEEQNIPISDPAIRLLCKHTHATTSSDLL